MSNLGRLPVKTPDEIKRGLECCQHGVCYGSVCPYYNSACRRLGEDALAYIQQLERERDALIEHLKLRLVCPMCKHYGQSTVEEPCAWCGSEHTNFEFCGVEEDDHATD